MRVTIRFEDEATLETSNDLIKLANLIEKECDVSVTQEKQKFQQGVKSRLTTRIAIIGLVLTTFQTIIGVAQFWTSENSKYMLKIYSEDNVLIYTLDNTNREEADRITSIIGSFPPDVTQNIEIRILKK